MVKCRDVSLYVEQGRNHEERDHCQQDIGNELNEPLYQESDWAVQLAEQTPLPSGESVGKVSGFSAGAAEIPEFLLMVQEHPRQLAEALLDVNLGVDVLVEMIQNLPQQVIQQQHQANPHEPQGEARQNPAVCVYEPESSDYCEFANGWFEGYSLYKVTEMVASAGLGSTSSIDDVVTTLRRVRDRVTSLRNFLADRELTFTSRTNYRLMTDGGRDFSDLNFDVPAGKTQLTITRLSRVDDSILESLSDSQKEQLGRYLADAGDDGVQTVNMLSVGNLNQFLDNVDNIPDRKVSQFLRTPENHRLVSDLANDRLRTAVRMAPADRQALRALAYHGDELQHVDPDLTASDIAQAADNMGPDSGNLRGVQVAAQADNGKTYLMTRTDVSHAYERHILGQKAGGDKDQTSFFPAGQTVEINGQSKTMDPRMPSQRSAIEEEIRELTYEALQNANPSRIEGNKLFYDGYNQYGITEVRLQLKRNSVESAFPTQGNNLWRWDNENQQWELITDGSVFRISVTHTLQ